MSTKSNIESFAQLVCSNLSKKPPLLIVIGLIPQSKVTVLSVQGSSNASFTLSASSLRVWLIKVPNPGIDILPPAVYPHAPALAWILNPFIRVQGLACEKDILSESKTLSKTWSLISLIEE